MSSQPSGWTGLRFPRRSPMSRAWSRRNACATSPPTRRRAATEAPNIRGTICRTLSASSCPATGSCSTPAVYEGSFRVGPSCHGGTADAPDPGLRETRVPEASRRGRRPDDRAALLAVLGGPDRARPLRGRRLRDARTGRARHRRRSESHLRRKRTGCSSRRGERADQDLQFAHSHVGGHRDRGRNARHHDHDEPHPSQLRNLRHDRRRAMPDRRRRNRSRSSAAASRTITAAASESFALEGFASSMTRTPTTGPTRRRAAEGPPSFLARAAPTSCSKTTRFWKPRSVCGSERASSPGPPPEKVVIQRSFFQNTLTPQGLALDVVAGNEIRFNNNVVDRYSDDVHVAEGVRGVFRSSTISFSGRKQPWSIPAADAGFLL